MQANPGELVFDFLDRLARHRGARLGTDSAGNFLLIGEHSAPVVQQLIEGQNIKKMQCIFSNEAMAGIYSVTGQKPATDGDAFKAASEMSAQAQGSLKFFKFLELPVEQNVKDQIELEMRATYQANEQEATLVVATVTVQGWLRDGNALWAPGDDVYVLSPMAMLNMVMKIQTATFTQDGQRGTQTELECVVPWKFHDMPYDVTTGMGNKNFPPPEPAKTTSDKPAEPPKPQPKAEEPLKPQSWDDWLRERGLR
jgi:prophage tail gpP-like protein